MEAIRSTDPRDAMALYERITKQRAEAQVEQPPPQPRRDDSADISTAAQQLADSDTDPSS